MSLFNKVLVIGLVTMALGSAAMGDGQKGTATDCASLQDARQKGGPAPASDTGTVQTQGTSAGSANDPAPAVPHP